MTDVDVIRNTKAYKDLLKTKKKNITEREFSEFSGTVCREAFTDVPDRTAGFNSAMGWWHKKREYVKQALSSDGITIHFADEFERQFKEWIGQQNMPETNGPLHALKVYSEKRQEFEELYRKNNDWI